MKTAVAALNDLLMLAHDALHAYATGRDRLLDAELRDHLLGFQLDHERHLSDLTALILRLGGTPKGRRDLRGPVLQFFAAFGALLGDVGVLRALRSTEEQLWQGYSGALKLELPEEAEALVRRAFKDLTRHLAYLGPAIEARQGESERPSAP